jgi:hypothetical protein
VVTGLGQAADMVSDETEPWLRPHLTTGQIANARPVAFRVGDGHLVRRPDLRRLDCRSQDCRIGGRSTNAESRNPLGPAKAKLANYVASSILVNREMA